MARKRKHHLKGSMVTVEVKFTGQPQSAKTTISGAGTLNLNLSNGVPFATVTVLDVSCPHCKHLKEALEEAEKEIERLTSQPDHIDIK